MLERSNTIEQTANTLYPYLSLCLIFDLNYDIHFYYFHYKYNLCICYFKKQTKQVPNLCMIISFNVGPTFSSHFLKYYQNSPAPSLPLLPSIISYLTILFLYCHFKYLYDCNGIYIGKENRRHCRKTCEG